MSVAAVLADLGTAMFGLPEGYWAVITCLVVVQGTLGATLDAALVRLMATVIGGIAGAFGGWLQIEGVPQVLALAILLPPLAVLAAYRPRYRLAPITAALVMLAIPGRSAILSVAFDRMAEIGLGGVIGAAVSLVLLPDRGAARFRRHAAIAIAILAELVSRHLDDGADVDSFNAQFNAALDLAAAAATEAAHERRFGVSSAPDGAPLMRTLRRLRTDAAMLGRIATAVSYSADNDNVPLRLAAWLKAASKALAEGEPAPPHQEIPILDDGPSNPLGLAHAVLRRDLLDLAERIDERRI